MSAFNIYKKEDHLNRAISLLDSVAITDHVYACLELRFCIEAIVYQNLLHGIENIPNTIIKTWQPQKAIKMLLDMESQTVTDCKIQFNLADHVTSPTEGFPKDGWMTMGEQKIPPIKWLSKNYNKLGNFLHLVEPSKAKAKNKKEIKEELAPIAEELREYVKGNLLITHKNIEINQCPICNQDFAFSTKKVKQGDVKKCSNFRCGGRFTVNIDKQLNKITFSHNTYDVNCPSCSKIMIIAEDKIKNLEKFSCKNCDSEFIPKGTYEFALVPKVI